VRRTSRVLRLGPHASVQISEDLLHLACSGTLAGNLFAHGLGAYDIRRQQFHEQLYFGRIVRRGLEKPFPELATTHRGETVDFPVGLVGLAYPPGRDAAVLMEKRELTVDLLVRGSPDKGQRLFELARDVVARHVLTRQDGKHDLT